MTTKDRNFKDAIQLLKDMTDGIDVAVQLINKGGKTERVFKKFTAKETYISMSQSDWYIKAKLLIDTYERT